MKPDLTELVFIIDRSGSMGGLEADTIGGFNSMLAKQKETEGLANITTILFDHNYQVLHDRLPIEKVQPLTNEDYYVGGTTALLDAMGRTIHHMGNVQKYSKSTDRAEKVIVVIITDGQENASSEYSATQVRQMVERQQYKFEWEFLFLGANIDAIATARNFNIRSQRTAQFHADGQGTRMNYDVVGETIRLFRQNSKIEDDWKSKIDKDYKSRK